MSEPAMMLSECAAQIRVKVDTLVKWIKTGKLTALVPPEFDPESRQTGPKGYRIMPDEWKRFLKDNSFTGTTLRADPEQKPPAPPKGPAMGTDGVKRRGRRTSN